MTNAPEFLMGMTITLILLVICMLCCWLLFFMARSLWQATKKPVIPTRQHPYIITADELDEETGHGTG